MVPRGAPRRTRSRRTQKPEKEPLRESRVPMSISCPESLNSLLRRQANEHDEALSVLVIRYIRAGMQATSD